MKRFTSKSQKTGEIGENIAARYLESKGFKIIERNHARKWGEIDIVASKRKATHFVEVKSVFCNPDSGEALSVRPEENLHGDKAVRLKRVIQTYLLQKGTGEKGRWQFDLVCVLMDEKTKKAKVKILENIIL